MRLFQTGLPELPEELLVAMIVGAAAEGDQEVPCFFTVIRYLLVLLIMQTVDQEVLVLQMHGVAPVERVALAVPE